MTASALRPPRALIQRLHVDGVTALVHTQATQEWLPHWHREWSIGAVLEGTCHCHIDRQAVTLTPGTLVSIAPQVIHTGALSQTNADARPRIVMVYVTPGWLAARRLPCPPACAIVHAPALVDRSATLRDGSQIDAWIAEALACVAAHAPPSPAPPRAAPPRTEQLLLQRLHEAIAAGETRVSALAQQCAISREHVHHIVRKWTGVAPSTYMRMARLQRACALLESGLPPTQVAAECAFADQAHFTRWFRKSFGYTPGDWVRASVVDAKPA